MRKVNNVSAVRLEFAHAILEARLRESFISIEYRDVTPMAIRGADTVILSEPLHDQTATKLVEAVENIAHKIASVSARNRCKVVTTPIAIMSADVKLTVIEYKDIK